MSEPKPITYSIDDFRQSISANIDKGALARIEHFDTINGKARPWNTAIAATVGAYGSSNTGSTLNSFQFLGTKIYALGLDSSTSKPAIYYWDYASQSWLGETTFASGASSACLFNYKGNLYGYYSTTSSGVTHIFKHIPGGATTPTHFDITNATSYAQPLVHSKDATAYLFLDNIVYSFDGTTATSVLSLPTNFKITSACEDGDFILIVGYDTDGKATGYLWDRDSSLATLTAKYDLGLDIPHHVAKLGGDTFFVSLRNDSTIASGITDQSVLTIRVRNGDRADILQEYQFTSLAMPNNAGNSYDGKYATSHRLYFSAYARLKGDTSAKNLIFRLDYDGKLSIALNLGVNSATTNPPLMTGIIRDGDSWWVAGKTDGNWTTSASTASYTTTAFFETPVIKSDSYNFNLDFRGATVICEALPSGAQIIIKARKNDETSWTTLKTFDTANAVKFVLPAMVAKNALSGLDSAKQVQFQVIAQNASGTSPAVIKGFQAVFNPINDEAYG